jgi:hypothetical protein
MENLTTPTPAQEFLADQVVYLELANIKLETEILRLKNKIADLKIAILKASILFDEVLDELENEK